DSIRPRKTLDLKALKQTGAPFGVTVLRDAKLVENAAHLLRRKIVLVPCGKTFLPGDGGNLFADFAGRDLDFVREIQQSNEGANNRRRVIGDLKVLALVLISEGNVEGLLVK